MKIGHIALQQALRMQRFFFSLRLRWMLPILFLLPLAYAQDIRNAEDVLRAMHDRYASSWYQTLTFTQKSTTYNPDGTSKAEIWHEALALPGKLRIDIGAPGDGNGYLMVDGTLTIFREGKESGTRPRMNMLLVLGFDVYHQAPQTTSAIVKAEGYDLGKLHEETWEGQPVYVVGAEKGDLSSKQFWVNKNNLLFVRLFEPTRTDPSKFQDIRFEDYREIAGGWVAARVEVYVDGKKTFSEEYSDIQTNAKLDPGTFDAKQFNSTHWEKP
jgi:outer membrane lipoprotein-sorting protein